MNKDNNINMKKIIKNSRIFLIFICLFLSKSFLYGLLSPKEEVVLDDIYIQKLEKELNDIQIIKGVFTKTDGVYGKVMYQNPYKFNEELIVATQSDDIEVGSYVINNEGLIGLVKNVYKNFVVVRMLTSKDIIMQIKVNDCYGLLKQNKITNISDKCVIENGDSVYTSDLNIRDEIIKIGTIHNNEIDLNINYNNLNYVIILTGDK